MASDISLSALLRDLSGGQHTEWYGFQRPSVLISGTSLPFLLRSLSLL